jgi:CBS domain-containing protein
MMAAHAISGVVVVDEQLPVGIFTERDAVRLIASGTDLTTMPLSAVMATPVMTTPETSPPRKAFDQMRDHAVRRLVVVNDQGGLAGMLTQTDLSRILDQQESSLLGELFETGPSPSGVQPCPC